MSTEEQERITGLKRLLRVIVKDMTDQKSDLQKVLTFDLILYFIREALKLMPEPKP